MFAVRPKLVVVHGGSAHRDDLLTVCVLLAQHPQAPVERRDPLAEELADPSVIVADVGMQHDPALNNFDHHQFSSDTQPICALTLVLRDMGLEQSARQVWPWMELTEVMDSRGPVVAARSLGVPRDAIAATFSPVERALLKEFSATRRLSCDDELHTRLRKLGRGMLDELSTIPARLRVLAVRAVQLKIGGLDALDLRNIDDPPLLGVELFCKSEAPDTALFITRSERDSGWSLVRRNDHPSVDFRRLQGHSAVTFIHPTGFMAALRADGDPLAVAALACGREGSFATGR